MSIRDEIHDASLRLGIGSEALAEVAEPHARTLIASFLEHFTGGVDGSWWWEHFTLPLASVHYADGKGFTRLWALVPDAQERVWLVAQDDELPFFPVYETTPAAAQQVIGECYGFEYYLIAKDLSWLLCENHHDTMIAVGSVRGRMRHDP